MIMLRFLSNLPDPEDPLVIIVFIQLGIVVKCSVLSTYQRLTTLCKVYLSAYRSDWNYVGRYTTPLLANNLLTRLIGFAGWGTAAVWGWLSAYEHVDIQAAANPFFATCELVPNFPTWAPLHEWLPAIFGATGECGDINWQFFSLSMPQWMLVIFSLYTGVLAVVLLARIATKRFV